MRFHFVLLIRLALLVTALVSGAAYAQQGPAQPTAAAEPVGNPPGGFFEDLQKSATVLKNKTNGALTDSLLNAGFKIGEQSIKWALGVAGSLALIYLIVESIGLLSGRNSSAKQVLFDVGLPVVLCSYLLMNYGTLMPEFAGKNGFLGYIRNLGGDPIASICDMYAVILEMVGRTISQACSSFLKTVSVFHLGTTLLAFFDALITVAFAIGIIGLCFLGLTDLIGLVLLGPFLGAVGVAFGPVFIAGLVTPWTREYFSKWLGFVVASAVVTGVLGVCTAIVSTLFSSFNFSNYAGVQQPSAATMLLVAIILMSINALIGQVPQIASAMVPGSIGASKGAGAAVREGAASVASKAGGSASQAKNMAQAANSRIKDRQSKNIETPAVAEAPLKYPSLNLN